MPQIKLPNHDVFYQQVVKYLQQVDSECGDLTQLYVVGSVKSDGDLVRDWVVVGNIFSYAISIKDIKDGVIAVQCPKELLHDMVEHDANTKNHVQYRCQFTYLDRKNTKPLSDVLQSAIYIHLINRCPTVWLNENDKDRFPISYAAQIVLAIVNPFIGKIFKMSKEIIKNPTIVQAIMDSKAFKPLFK